MATITDETKVALQEESTEAISAYNRIPYALISSEIEGSAKDVLAEFTEIVKYYKIYKKGRDFHPEGTNGDYVPANLNYRMAATLINKEARFLFGEAPDISITAKAIAGQIDQTLKENLDSYNGYVSSVLDAAHFEEKLIKAAKDCFIGKRVAVIVNFNEDDGVTIDFVKSTDFLYETKPGNPTVITKFVAFFVAKDQTKLTEKRILKKKFVLEEVDGEPVVYMEEILYDGVGTQIEESMPYQKTLLSEIPVCVILNDGLTGDMNGESELWDLSYYEKWYSKLAGADIDSQRKSMNPTKYTIDMDNNSTKRLSTGAGAFWDLMTDQNLDNKHPAIGMLEPNMSYSNALTTTLNRVKELAYDLVDMPDIESLQASITSGKALKAIYWPLIVRCKEKMKTWGPQLKKMIDIIIQGAYVYPNCITNYVDEPLEPFGYEVNVEAVLPLPEDETEEKNLDLSEVAAQTMSKKAYMKKWRNLTDDEVNDELQQIALERQILEESSMTGVSPLSDGTLTVPVEGEEDETEPGVEPTGGPVSSGINLSNTQMNTVITILQYVEAGTLTEGRARTLLKAFGFDVSDIDSLLSSENPVVEV